MKRFTEPACGKCTTCGDQLLSVPGRNHADSRRIVCPFCVTNNYEDVLAREAVEATVRIPTGEGTVILTREEVERCSE